MIYSIPRILLVLITCLLSASVSFGQSQSFSGGYSFSMMACQNGNVYHSGSISGTTSFVLVPKGEQTGNTTAYLNKINQVNGGSGSHALALACDGAVYAWGGNANGQLGNGTTTTSATPVRVLTGEQGSASGFLEDVKFVAGGDLSSYALLNDGRVMAWGSNGSGRLGNGTTTQSTTPVFVKTNSTTQLTGITQVYGGEEFAVALKSDGTCWVWGSNLHECSNGAASTYAKQVLKADGTPLTNIVRISGGDTHVLALDSDGTLWSWGGNWERQLGDGLSNDDAYPKPVLAVGATAPTTSYLQGVVNFSAGAFMSVAVLSDGRMVGWGTNRDNSNGTGASTMVPQYILNSAGTAPIENIVDVATGDRHGFAVDADGQLYTWGWNSAGQLALGNTTNYNYPQPVTMPCEIRTPCPLARLGPDVTLCNPVSVQLYAGSAAPYFMYEWYKDGILLTEDTTAYLAVNTPGTYKIVITDTSAVTTCTPCAPSEDEIVISTSTVAPINANFCAPPSKSVTLGVNSALTTFNWYSASTGGSLLASGTNAYTTPLISTTTTYYVEDTRTFSYTTGYTSAGTGLSSLSSAYNNSASGYMQFTVQKQLTLVSVNVRGAGGCTGSINRTINLTTTGGAVLQSSTQPMNCTAGAVTTFPLNFVIAPGTYRLAFTPSHNVQYFDAGASYPFGVTNLISLTGTGKWDNSASSFFFDWVVQAATNCARIPVIANYTGSCPLPVELLNFQGTKINSASYLTWTTGTEINAAAFEVERSLDGINFSHIGTVNASGNSDNSISYEFVDGDVSEVNATVYYRLKQVDNDGYFEYSKVISISHDSEALSVNVFPNPAQKGENLHVTILSDENSEVHLKLYDRLGKEIVSSRGTVSPGSNELVMNVSDISSGLYILEVSQESKSSEMIKLIVE